MRPDEEPEDYSVGAAGNVEGSDDDRVPVTVLPDEHVPTPAETADTLLGDDQPDQVEDEATDAAAAVAEPTIELPEDPEAARDLLIDALAETRRVASEYLETIQRIAAEYDNYRKRTERDHVDTVVRAAKRIVEQLLPTLDNFDAALAYEPQTPAEEKILDGMRGTHAQLMDTLAREGLESVEAVGHTFDPAVHEAVAGPTGEGDHLVVTQELRRGYLIRGKLVRPSMVMVEAQEPTDDEHD